jgi:hypothetical protein
VGTARDSRPGPDRTGRAPTVRVATAPDSSPDSRRAPRNPLRGGRPALVGHPFRAPPPRRRPEATGEPVQTRISAALVPPTRAARRTRSPATCSGRHPIRQSLAAPSRSPQDALPSGRARLAPPSSRPSSPRRARRGGPATSRRTAAGKRPRPRAIRLGLHPDSVRTAPARSSRRTGRAPRVSPAGRGQGSPAALRGTAPSAPITPRRHHAPGDRRRAP